MIRVAAFVLLFLASLCGASAQYDPYIASGNVPVAPHVTMCAGPNKTAIECGTAAAPLPTQNGVPTASGALDTIYKLSSSAASTNAAIIRVGNTRVYKVTGYNPTAAVKWLRFYSRTSSPPVGTASPLFVLALPPGAFSYDNNGIGFFFSAGFAISITGGAADLDATALAAGDIVNLMIWYQ